LGRQEVDMQIEFSKDELALVEMLLSQEESDINIEIHHCRNLDYKEFLFKRQSEIHEILAKISGAVPIGAT
jgi:hypothetical protein